MTGRRTYVVACLAGHGIGPEITAAASRALAGLGREHGFAIEEVRAVHPMPEGSGIPILESDAPELQRVIHAINDRIFAPQDLRLVLRRTA